MANPETIITSIRRRCTEVFEACQEHLPVVADDEGDFTKTLGKTFFTNWFDTVSGYDIDMEQLEDAIEAMQAIKVVVDAHRPALQIVRIR